MWAHVLAYGARRVSQAGGGALRRVYACVQDGLATHALQVWVELERHYFYVFFCEEALRTHLELFRDALLFELLEAQQVVLDDGHATPAFPS